METIKVVDIGDERGYNHRGKDFIATRFMAERADGEVVEAEVSRVADNDKARPQVGQSLEGTLDHNDYGWKFKRSYSQGGNGLSQPRQAPASASAPVQAAPRVDAQKALGLLASWTTTFYRQILSEEIGDISQDALLVQAGTMARQVFINSGIRDDPIPAKAKSEPTIDEIVGDSDEIPF